MTSFCNATIEYIIPNQNIKSVYFLKEDHSLECENLFPGNTIKNNDDKPEQQKVKDKEKFINECKNIMNSSNIYDRNLYKEKF